MSAQGNLRTVDWKEKEGAVAVTIPDVVASEPRIDVQRRSVLTPKSSQVRIRGMDERRSLILLDGRSLNGTGVMGGQFVDWSALAVGDWRAIEIDKGAFTAEFGNTLGGTINLVPFPPSPKPTVSIEGGLGKYNTYKGSVNASGRVADFGTRLRAEYVETNGNLRNSSVNRSHFSEDFSWFWG